MIKRFLFFGLVITLAINGCAPRFPARKEFLMDTEVEITLPEGNAEDFAAAFSEIGRIEELMDVHNPGSEISQVNRLAGQRPIKVSEEIFEVLKSSLEFSRLTSGAFDVSIRPLSQLWGTKGKFKEIPGVREIEEKLALINYRNIILDKRNQAIGFKREGMAIDLGGIAKGYAIDQAIEVLKKRGIKEALIDAGGDIRVMGERRWKVGLQHPRKQDEILTVIRLKDRAIATSGDYQRYFVKEGKRYHHIINPETGYPAAGCMSVTILASQAIQADTLATSVFILGPEKGMKLIESQADVEGVIIDTQGKILLSSGLKTRLQISPEI